MLKILKIVGIVVAVIAAIAGICIVVKKAINLIGDDEEFNTDSEYEYVYEA